MTESFFDRINKNKTLHTPDVLSCLANLSNDEVFTPPEVVNKMLDMLPQELFENPNTTFLDPASKTGVFLREIAKRLLIGLEKTIPDLQERIDHIFHKQLYGIAITELTSLLSRRSVYCSKSPDGRYSVSQFNSSEGNIRFRKIKHTWTNGKCKYCGASKSEYDRSPDLETHAYEFIHTDNLEKLFNMKFDVIIGNPPYQLSDGGAGASAKPIYHLFVQQAKKLKPRYLSMITPSRWFAGGKGLDEFRSEMLEDDRLTIIHDFPNASDCFMGVEIKGGVNYFLWTADKKDDCTIYTHNGNDIVSVSKRPLIEKNCDVFIRHNSLVSIFRKVSSFKEPSFMDIVSARKPYGLCGDFFKDPAKYSLPSISTTEIKDGLVIHGLDEHLKRCKRYISKNYPLPKKDYVDGYKMFMARNQGSGLLGEVFSYPIFAKPNECCTETFVVIGTFKNEKEMLNCWSYMTTKFFRAMVGVKKNDQGMAQGVYKFVPLQDFSKPWTDKELYEKYNFSQEEIDFIETMIAPMDGGNE